MAVRQVSAEIDSDLPGLVEALATSMTKHGLVELQVEAEGVKIQLKRGSPPAATTPASTGQICSPAAGTFFASVEGSPALVSVGAKVNRDTPVGFVKTPNEVLEVAANVEDAIITRLVTVDGQPVQQGSVLFETTKGG